MFFSDYLYRRNGRILQPEKQHPSIFIRISEVRSQRQQVQEGNPDIPLSSDTPQLLLGGPEAFPGQMGYKPHLDRDILRTQV